MAAHIRRQSGPKGRDWAYDAFKKLERWRLLTRRHELSDGGQLVIRHWLHHRPVADEERTFEPSKVVPRVRRHPGAKERASGLVSVHLIE